MGIGKPGGTSCNTSPNYETRNGIRTATATAAAADAAPASSCATASSVPSPRNTAGPNRPPTVIPTRTADAATANATSRNIPNTDRPTTFSATVAHAARGVACQWQHTSAIATTTAAPVPTMASASDDPTTDAAARSTTATGSWRRHGRESFHYRF